MTPAGEPIEIRYRRNLNDTAGNPAHAATFIRRRLIVLDAELRRDPREHSRVLAHEVFHFTWVRLGNTKRRSWETLLRFEWNVHTHGEAGWSAEWRKDKLGAADVRGRTRKWREYCCESFCDSAAYFATGASSREVTLSRAVLVLRRQWFAKQLPEPFPI